MLKEILDTYGTLKEVPGPNSNPKLLSIIKTQISTATDDSTISWCSILMINAFKDKYVITGATLAARSWLKVGKETKTPTVGDSIVVFKRGTGWQGHVGIFMGFSDDKTKVLTYGGNQGNALNKTWYKVSDVLGYRNLEKVKPVKEVATTSQQTKTPPATKQIKK